MSKEKNVVNLKNLVQESAPAIESKATVVTEAFEKFSLLGETHGFGKAIKISNDYKIRSIDSLLQGSKGGVVRIPLKGLTYATLRFSEERIKNIIMDNPRLNPEMEVMENIVSALDEAILKEKFKDDKDGYEAAIDKLLGELIKNEETNKDELVKKVKTGKLIKDVIIQESGQIYIIFHNHLLIANKVSGSILASLPENEQNRIYKDAIPSSLIKLRKSGVIEANDRTRLNVGRIGYDLALPIDSKVLFNDVILPTLIVDKGFKAPSLDINGNSKLREAYSKAIKVGAVTVSKGHIYFAIETLHNRINYDLLTNKSNFVCCNLSFKNDAFMSLLKYNIEKDYVGFIDTSKALEITPNDPAGLIEDKFKMRKDYTNKLNADVLMIPISEVSTFKTIGGKPLTDFYIVDKYNSPLYVAVVELAVEPFKDVVRTSPLSGSLLFRLAEKTRVAIDYNKLSETFDKYIINRDPIVSNSTIDSSFMGLIPDLKKSMLHMLTSDSENEIFSDYNVSINSDSESIAFAINIGIDLAD